jgi:serine/threonine protein kinase
MPDPISLDTPARPEPLDGRYRLGRLIAGGGGANVFVAEHRFTRHTVAIKIPLDSKSNRHERMRREIDALARVHGAGIVEMLDAGETREGPYIVFELLEGRTLAGLLAARGRLDIEETLKLGIEVGAALSRCHAKGVVHRDIKPSNVFVTGRANPQLRLLDFGIAKLGDGNGEGEKLTKEHVLLGTPEYMAPEALLATRDVDHRADIYALGVLLYECLTGTVPFDGNYAEVLLKLSTTSARPVRELRPDVPEALVKIIDRSLSRAPEDRFQSAEEMQSALAALAGRSLDSLNLLMRERKAPEPAAQRHRPEAETLADGPQAKSPRADWTTRRKHPRAPYTTLARITRQGGKAVDGRIDEVSEGGLQFVGDCAIDVSERVVLRFALPASGTMIQVAATARWNRTVRGTNATGFEFADLAESAKDELRRYVGLMCRLDPR